MRDKNSVLERDVALLRTENDTLKARVKDLDGTSKNMQLRIDEELNK